MFEAWCVLFCCCTTCTASDVTTRSLLPRLLQSEKQAINRLWWFFFSLSDTLRELCPLGTLYWKYFSSAWPLYLTGTSIETCLIWVTASARPHDGVTSPTYHTYLLYASVTRHHRWVENRLTEAEEGKRQKVTWVETFTSQVKSCDKLKYFLFSAISAESCVADLLEFGDKVCDEGNQANH